MCSSRMIGRRILIAGSVAAVAAPALGQVSGKPGMPVIGVLWHAGNAEEEAPYFQTLIQGFRSLGYVDGQNLSLVHRFPNEDPVQFAQMAAELVALKPDAIVAVGGAAPYAKSANSTIPIVFMYVPDPIGAKLVNDIRHPGGNVTGLTNFSVELSAKRLELMKDFVPGLSRVGLLVNPNVLISRLYVEQARAAQSPLGLETEAFEAPTLASLEPAFDAMARSKVQAVIVNAESLFYLGKQAIAKLALERMLPTCVWVREVVEAGALVSYGADQRAIARRVPAYVDRILKGEKPATIPVEQPSRFELVINAGTAKRLGLGIPPIVLGRSDDITE